MRAPSIDTGTALRLTRIAALVAGCLLFLHACDRTRKVIPLDVWIELGAAAALGVGAMVTAWFEISRTDRGRPDEPPEEFVFDSGDRSVRARIAGSGNLVFHGRVEEGPHAGHEWSWTFRPATFDAVRKALGGDGDLIALLDEVVPTLTPEAAADPGGWLRAHGIAATYREKGEHPSRITDKLPIFRPTSRRATERPELSPQAPAERRPRAADPRVIARRQAAARENEARWSRRAQPDGDPHPSMPLPEHPTLRPPAPGDANYRRPGPDRFVPDRREPSRRHVDEPAPPHEQPRGRWAFDEAPRGGADHRTYTDREPSSLGADQDRRRGAAAPSSTPERWPRTSTPATPYADHPEDEEPPRRRPHRYL
ncbi:hypothetical protein IU433_28165 [Nocardia puris]|uniref:Uncharacterized protein n=1 Tax=Nocardia puris TaxID=208602 RepID=A0A366E2Y3_9NOCA|nr:hypothetical protein [Nocardia puris]MBF6214351.1 hypothetical protein [Nocardia puris]MBF6368966.1 hypothetical protein [Nocardia puris]MBF6462886.1 hypothetical protein [Nocardia puris]RBO96730.1 hypothetical protein DFR74_101746 [Nocardia puris]